MDRIEEIRARLAKATKGPWRSHARKPSETIDGKLVVDFDARPEAHVIWRTYTDDQQMRCHHPVGETYVVGQGWDEAEANAAFIAHSWQDITDLLAEIDRLNAQYERIMTVIADQYPE